MFDTLRTMVHPRRGGMLSSCHGCRCGCIVALVPRNVASMDVIIMFVPWSMHIARFDGIVVASL